MKIYKNKALFLDRDGVINKEKNYVHKIKDFEFIDTVFEACRYFQEKGYLIIVITNQAGIAKGLYTEQDFQVLTKWMIKEFEKKKLKYHKYIIVLTTQIILVNANVGNLNQE